MDARNDIREFLTSRRAKITPERAGLPAGHNRRVKGLRREEVAMLAGISVEYYTRLERGSAAGASEDVLEGIARALHLDDAERAHLFDLVRAANATSTTARRRPSQERVRPIIQRILDSITAPAYVRNGRLDILAANALGAALYAPVLDDAGGTPNMARFIFLNPQASEFFHNWESIANDAVAILRAEAGRAPTTNGSPISLASCRREATSSGCGGPPITLSSTAPAPRHSTTPSSATWTLTTKRSSSPATRASASLIYSAEPASPSQEALDLLASWATTPAAIRPDRH